VGFYWKLAHKEKQTARASETTVSIREKGFLLFLFYYRYVKLKKERKSMKNKEFWKTVIHIVVTVLTALGTTLGVSACALN